MSIVDMGLAMSVPLSMGMAKLFPYGPGSEGWQSFLQGSEFEGVTSVYKI